MPTNRERADWASDALALFAFQTFFTPVESGSPDEEDCIADLICNLLHLASLRGHDPDTVLRQATMNFEAERHNDPDEED